MFPEVIAALRAHKPALTDRLIERITSSMAPYAASDARELRRNIEALIDDVLAFLEAGDRTAYTERVAAISKARIDQGFAPGDVLQALLVAAPVVRDMLRAEGPRDDPAFAQAFDSAEAAIHELAAVAGALYVEHVARRMKAKNDELTRLNQRLAVQEELLSAEVVGVSRALENARQFLRSTIDSLSSGLLVVDSATRRISLYSNRAEQILGIPAEEALGHDVVAALGELGGIDIQSIVNKSPGMNAGARRGRKSALRADCGSWERSFPGLGERVVAMMCALVLDVADEWVEIARADGLGPVADLPDVARDRRLARTDADRAGATTEHAPGSASCPTRTSSRPHLQPAPRSTRISGGRRRTSQAIFTVLLPTAELITHCPARGRWSIQ